MQGGHQLEEYTIYNKERSPRSKGKVSYSQVQSLEYIGQGIQTKRKNEELDIENKKLKKQVVDMKHTKKKLVFDIKRCHNGSMTHLKGKLELEQQMNMTLIRV